MKGLQYITKTATTKYVPLQNGISSVLPRLVQPECILWVEQVSTSKLPTSPQSHMKVKLVVVRYSGENTGNKYVSF